MRQFGAYEREPEAGELGQEGAFLGHAVGHYHVEGGDPVGGYEEQGAGVDGEDFADFAAGDLDEAGR